MRWLQDNAELYRARIVCGKLSTARIMKMTGLPEAHAKALARYCRAGEVPKPPLPEPGQGTEEKTDGQQYLLDSAYVYNQHNDTYVTFLPDLPKPLVLPGAVHREIVRAYSNFDGNPASVNEIARSVRLPRVWVVKYLRVHGITHDREPFTPEEILSRTDDELVEDALQLRRAALYKKIEQAKWADIREDALKWRAFEDHTLRVITSALQARKAPKIPKLRLGQPVRPYVGVVGLSDFHWGKYSDPGENWETYNREVARTRLFQATEDVAARMSLFGAPQCLYVPIGSDFMHVDTEKGTTTNGTPQDMDGTPAEILVSACHLMEEWIHTLRQLAPVELVLMSGNHDRMTGLALLLYLEALFRHAPDVTVHLERTPRVYRRFGSNQIGFVHGDGVRRTQELAGHMAREDAPNWAACPHKTIYTGHLHSERTETDVAFGVTRRQLPSLSGPDRWHALNGYVGSPKYLPVYLHDHDRGLMASLYGPA